MMVLPWKNRLTHMEEHLENSMEIPLSFILIYVLMGFKTLLMNDMFYDV